MIGETLAPWLVDGPPLDLATRDPAIAVAEQPLVLADCLLQDIRDYRAALQRWFAMLRVGGRLVVTVPHAFLRDRTATPPSPWSRHQLRLYTPRSLLEEVEEALAPNSYRIRWAGDCDADYDYALSRDAAPVGEHQAGVVIERIVPPAWGLAPAPQGDPAGPHVAFEPERTRVEATIPATVQRILALKLDHLGDFVLGVPAMRRLRAAFPQAHITLIAGSWNLELAHELELFDRILPFDAYPRNSSEEEPDPRGRLAAFDALVTEAYDLAIDLRTDPDTRIFLKNVRAGARAGLGTRAAFPHLDIFLPVDGTRQHYEAAETVTIAPQDFAVEGRHCARSPYHIACRGGAIGAENAFVWGPYRRLRAGHYRFEPFLDVDRGSGGSLRGDVALDRARVTEGQVTEAGALTLDFHNGVDDAEFEFRFWANPGEPVRRFQFFGGRLVRAGAASVLHQSEYVSLLVELAAMRLHEGAMHALGEAAPGA